MEKNGGLCELQNAEKNWSGKVEKRDGINTEGEGKESLNMVWGGGGVGVPRLAEGRLLSDVFQIRIRIRIHQIHMFLGLPDPDP
jgi:hypothetical protein